MNITIEYLEEVLKDLKTTVQRQKQLDNSIIPLEDKAQNMDVYITINAGPFVAGYLKIR